MKVVLWGTRGSLASPGPDTVRYGGNTSCVSVEGEEGTILVLDAGTGVRVLGQTMSKEIKCANILLTHLHMDHVQGLPFFAPFLRSGVEVHIWGPASTTMSLQSRLRRYISPPLFPVRARDFLSTIYFHELSMQTVEIGEFRVTSQMVLHPNPTVGYRLECGGKNLAYLPDHEPALGVHHFPISKEWTSGYNLAAGVDLLIHDAQYNDQEYRARRGFGHSSAVQTIKFARLVEARHLVPFHHDPAHSDVELDELFSRAMHDQAPSFPVTPGVEGAKYIL
jgi:phosphoribosyl 1,2-cyclic phosphodiesterase